MKYLHIHTHACTHTHSHIHTHTYTLTHTHSHTHSFFIFSLPPSYPLCYPPSYPPFLPLTLLPSLPSSLLSSLPLTLPPCRNIESDLNVFQGLVGNPIFVGILMFTVVAQYGLVEFGGAFVRTVRARKRSYK